jgi:NAD(P)-dependent dehydrogenase (short-subunit alcohol dehydrogenase family)
MAERPRVALVTGANRGIGLEIARQLAAQGLDVIIGARDERKGDEAARRLTEEGLAVRARVVDVADDESVGHLRSAVLDELGRLDVLVNNAGIVIDSGASAIDVDLDRVRKTLETNTFGAWRMCRAFVASMRDNGYGRVVNVSSGMGGLTEMGGGTPGYRISKAGLNVITRTIAAGVADENVLVNSACPGWVKTDMGGSRAPRSIPEGADTPVWLATLPDDGPRGGFFRDRKPIAW